MQKKNNNYNNNNKNNNNTECNINRMLWDMPQDHTLSEYWNSPLNYVCVTQLWLDGLGIYIYTQQVGLRLLSVTDTSASVIEMKVTLFLICCGQYQYYLRIVIVILEPDRVGVVKEWHVFYCSPDRSGWRHQLLQLWQLDRWWLWGSGGRQISDAL